MKKSTKSFQTNEEINSAQSNPIQSEKDGSPCEKKILIIEDDAGIAELIRESLEEKNYRIKWVENFEAADLFLKNEESVLMIVDYRIAGAENAEEWILRRRNEGLIIPPFIMSTGQGDERIAVKLMKLGARDYLIKDSHFLEILPFVVSKICDEIETEQKLRQAEKALTESEEKYRLLLENSELGVGLFDLNGKILLFNEKAVQNLGGKLEDYVGKTLIEVFGKEVGGIYIRRINETVENGKSIEFEDFVSTLSGEYWFLSNHACIKNTKGEIIGVQVISHDITERKQTEQEIERLKNHFQAIIEKASDGVIVLDAQSKVKYVSSTALKMFGYDAADLKAFNPNMLTHSDDLPMVLGHLQQIINNPKYTPTLEYRFAKKHGGWIWIESTFTNLYGNSDVQGLVINFRDITERKIAEKKLIENRDVLNKVLVASSGFIESTSEEINFPKLTDTIIEISGAKYGAFNLFDENGLDFTTVAFSGLSNVNTVSKSVLGIDLINKKWNYDPVRAEKINGKKIAVFSSLHELVGSFFSNAVITLIEKTFSIGEVAVVTLNKNNVPVGDFTLMFEKNKTIQHKEVVELFANQVGQFIVRKQAEAEVRESEKKYRFIFNNNPQPMWIFDVESYQFLEVNQSAINHYGYSREEFLSMTIRDIRPVEDIDSLHNIVNLAERNYSSTEPIRHKKKNGEIIYVEISSFLVDFEQRKARHVLVNDVTERKNSQDALKEKMDELIRFQRLTVGRELAMIELKKEINKLLKEMGEEEKYSIIE